MYQYPYGNAQQLNLDWLMEQWQEVKQSIDGSLQGEIDRVEAAITDLLNARDAAVAAASAANTSAGAAASSANTAAGQAAIATAQAAAATQERINAANAANNAQTYAGNAQIQATAAANSAGAAYTSASQAAASASDAHDDALAAAQDAADAHNDALAAAQDADDAHADAVAAQAVLDSIPADYSTLSDDVDDLKASVTPYYETTNIASRAYTMGEYLVYNGVYYKTTAAISAGATLVPNTNITETNISSELASIKTGNYGDIITYATNKQIKKAGVRNPYAYYFQNNFTIAMNKYIINEPIAGTRNGFTICGNQIIKWTTTSSNTTRKYASILTTTGTPHIFTGSYNTASIPINTDAWIPIADVFGSTAISCIITAAKNNMQTTGNISDQIRIYFGFMDAGGSIVSKAVEVVAGSTSANVVYCDISSYLQDQTEYNVFALYFDDHNGAANRTSNTLYGLDLICIN